MPCFMPCSLSFSGAIFKLIVWTLKTKNLSANNFPPFTKGGEGGIYDGNTNEILLSPPFSKGDFTNNTY